MADQETAAQCPKCQRQVLARRPAPNHLLHFIITFFTCGLWVVPWLAITFGGGKPWLCPTCGSAVVQR